MEYPNVLLLSTTRFLCNREMDMSKQHLDYYRINVTAEIDALAYLKIKLTI